MDFKFNFVGKDDFLKIILDNLRTQINFKGMSLKDLADKADIPVGDVGNYFSRETPSIPSFINMVKMALVAEIDIKNLLRGTYTIDNDTKAEVEKPILDSQNILLLMNTIKSKPKNMSEQDYEYFTVSLKILVKFIISHLN